MDSSIGRPSHWFIRVLIPLMFLGPSTLAQQTQSQPPAPPPAQSPADKPKEVKENQDKKTPDDAIGKSKLERKPEP